MRGRAFLLVLLVAASGCSGSGARDPGTEAPPIRPETEIQAERPVWSLGQSWKYVVDVPGARARTFTMMVAENRTDLWVVASNDRQQALHHAVYSTNPVLGRIGKETLSPFQGGGPVSMYAFPLTDGKQWVAPFFDQEMRFTATFTGDLLVEPSLDLGAYAEGFRIVASGGDGSRVVYDFVESVGWFTSFEVLNAAGERVIRLDLIEAKTGYRGSYHFLRGEDLVVEEVSGIGQPPQVVDVPVAEPKKFFDGLALGISYVGAPGNVPATLNLTMRGPPGDTVYWQGEITGLGQRFLVQDIPGAGDCLDPDTSDCSGAFALEAIVLGETRAEVRVISYQAFAEGSL